MPNFFHITSKKEWAQSEKNGVHTTLSLETEGFIHCSFRKQVCATAERHFRGRSDLLLLEINPIKVLAEIKAEGSKDKFPHIYGPLNLNAIEAVYKLPLEKDGSFLLPDALVGQGHL